MMMSPSLQNLVFSLLRLQTQLFHRLQQDKFQSLVLPYQAMFKAISNNSQLTRQLLLQPTILRCLTSKTKTMHLNRTLKFQSLHLHCQTKDRTSRASKINRLRNPTLEFPSSTSHCQTKLSLLSLNSSNNQPRTTMHLVLNLNYLTRQEQAWVQQLISRQMFPNLISLCLTRTTRTRCSNQLSQQEEDRYQSSSSLCQTNNLHSNSLNSRQVHQTSPSSHSHCLTRLIHSNSNRHSRTREEFRNSRSPCLASELILSK